MDLCILQSIACFGMSGCSGEYHSDRNPSITGGFIDGSLHISLRGFRLKCLHRPSLDLIIPCRGHFPGKNIPQVWEPLLVARHSSGSQLLFILVLWSATSFGRGDHLMKKSAPLEQFGGLFLGLPLKGQATGKPSFWRVEQKTPR